MMTKYKGYDEAKPYVELERQPRGGYVIAIKNAEFIDGSREGKSDRLIFSYDIAEGEYAGLYMQDWKNQSGIEDRQWRGTFTMFLPNETSDFYSGQLRRFKTNISKIEESNAGFHFDGVHEETLKGKLVGAVFNNREYRDSYGIAKWALNFKWFETVENIRAGKYKVPNDSTLEEQEQRHTTNRSYGYTPETAPNEGFMDIPDNVEDEGLPFN